MKKNLVNALTLPLKKIYNVFLITVYKLFAKVLLLLQLIIRLLSNIVTNGVTFVNKGSITRLD